jgi:uncharacterized protein YhbP (UPF0306 family)
MAGSRLHEKVVSYLRRHNVMTLATCGPHGTWAAAVFYANEGYILYFLSAPSSRHSLNLSVQPSVSVTIQGDCSDWRSIQGIQLGGKARFLQGNERDHALGCYRERFPFTCEGVSAQIDKALRASGCYAVVPGELYFIDNTRGLGHRDAIALPGRGG